jgi:hypothetical protein
VADRIGIVSRKDHLSPTHSYIGSVTHKDCIRVHADCLANLVSPGRDIDDLDDERGFPQCSIGDGRTLG